MNTEEKDYKEERFEFTLYVNDNIICKRNFKIFNYIENSMNTLEFKETVDRVVKMIDDDLKSKTRVYLWYHYNPQSPTDNEELISPLVDPWTYTFKLTITDNKKEVISKIWDGYAYPRAIRSRIDLSNKYVTVTTKDGQVFSYDKDTYFATNGNRLGFDQEVMKAMIGDKSDVLYQIIKAIREACSVDRDEIRENGYQRNNSTYLSNYTIAEKYGNGDGAKEYTYSLALANRRIERDWERKVAKKTKEYFKNLY